jgi:hypothetical protein
MKQRISFRSVLRNFAGAAFLLAATPALADCLSSAEARAAVDGGQAVPLHVIASGLGGEVVKAQLCRSGGRLVYVVGVLQQNGQVVRRTIDARTGQVLE